MSCIVAEQTVVSLGGGSTETVPLLNGSLGEGTAWFASSGSVESLLCYWPRPGSDRPPPTCVFLLSLVQRQGRALFMH